MSITHSTVHTQLRRIFIYGTLTKFISIETQYQTIIYQLIQSIIFHIDFRMRQSYNRVYKNFRTRS